MHGGEEKRVQDFGGNARRKNHLEDRGIAGRMGLEWIIGR
jgi:hypothetical protein